MGVGSRRALTGVHLSIMMLVVFTRCEGWTAVLCIYRCVRQREGERRVETEECRGP